MMLADQYEYREATSPQLLARFLKAIHVDSHLLAGLLAILAIGLVVLYSAGGRSEDLLMKQLVRIGAAFAALIVFAQLPPILLRRWSPWVFFAGLVMLTLVLLTGDIGKGAQRWLDLGVVRFQPSELMKLAVPMAAAWYLHDRPLPPDLPALAVLLLIVVVPTLMIAIQPDLGTALLIAASGVFVAWLAGMSARVIIFGGAAGVALAPALWYYMHDYQKQRVLTFLNPESDPLGSGYHIIQSKIAIGSGGLFGKGWLNGSQSQLQFLPEPDTDFIFAVMGEEFGLLGLLALLAVYVFVIGRGMYIAVQARDTFSRLLAGSISLTFFVYVIVNTGMVTGLLPVVGIPLPLVSYGGTSIVTLMAGFGILMSIQTHRKFLPK